MSLIASFLALAATQGQGPAPASDVAAIRLFEDACINGQASLPRESTQVAQYRRMPAYARAALGRTERRNGPPPGAPVASQVPNTIYRVAGEGRTFLVAPSQTPAPSTVMVGRVQRDNFHDSCAVLWRGGDRDFIAALRLLLPDVRQEFLATRSALPSATRNGHAYLDAPRDGYRLIAAAYGGWIVLRAAPDEKAPAAER